MLGKHRTTIETDGDNTIIIYYTTPVVSFNADTITLDNGGHQTHSTKRRMNQASKTFGLGFRVYQQAFDWYVAQYDDNKSTKTASNQVRVLTKFDGNAVTLKR